MTTRQEMERQAEKLSKVYQLRNAIIDGLEKAIHTLESAEMPKLRKAMEKLNEQHDELRALIVSSPELFTSPRTITAHGIKFGYQKGKGKVEIDDEDKLIARIRKVVPDAAGTLIVEKETVSKTELVKLPADVIKRLGVRIIDSGDQVVIKAVDSDHDKLAAMYLSDGAEEERVA